MKMNSEIATINLNDGHLISITDLRIRGTYSDVWPVFADKYLNNSIIEQECTYPQEWVSGLKVLLLRPDQDAIERILPAFRITALLNCNQRVNPGSNGSILAVAFFTDKLLELGIKDLLQEALKDIDWKSNCHDYIIKTSMDNAIIYPE